MIDITIQKAIGIKYVTNMFKDKYNVLTNEVYLEERRKVLISSDNYLYKVVNDIKLYKER